VDRTGCGDARLTVLPTRWPDTASAASTSDRESMQASLRLHGANPLLVEAFGFGRPDA